MTTRNAIPSVMLCAALLGGACSTGGRISNRNLAYIYRKDYFTLHPVYRVFHLNDSVSRLYYKIHSRDLLYSRKQNESDYTARIAVRYALLDSFEAQEIRDSATAVTEHRGSNASNRVITGHLDFRSATGTSLLMEITFTDLNRKESAVAYVTANKKSAQSAQHFILTDSGGNRILFRNHAAVNEPFAIRMGNTAAPRIFVRYYRRDFPLAPPPFSMNSIKPFRYEADSTFHLDPSPGNLLHLSPDREGFYHFQTDTAGKDGFTLFVFANHFPKVTKADDLLPPLKYLTTQKEYEALETSEDTKKAVDEFWMGNGDNAERARELIRKYYNRVQDASDYFTSYMEGWKTDRGLIYIIYGPPNVIYKTSNSETWIYGEENNALSLNFSFVKVDNPFTENDFSLNRSPIYKNSWYRAVDTWRQGRVY